MYIKTKRICHSEMSKRDSKKSQVVKKISKKAIKSRQSYQIVQRNPESHIIFKKNI